MNFIQIFIPTQKNKNKATTYKTIQILFILKIKKNYINLYVLQLHF
jgi:hypothetical protein